MGEGGKEEEFRVAYESGEWLGGGMGGEVLGLGTGTGKGEGGM